MSLLTAVTQNLSRSSGIDDALHSFCLTMAQILPIEGMFFGKHFPNKQQVLFFAQSSLEKSLLLNLSSPVSPVVQDYLISSKRPEACTYELRDFPSMSELNARIIPVDRSYMELRLRIDNKPIGMLGIYSGNQQKFNDAAAKLMLDFREPLSNTITRHLKHEKLAAVSKFPLCPDLQDDEHFFMHSHHMREVMRQADATAPYNNTVLLLGETGVGKGVLARYIHAHSKRNYAPFIHVNCASLTESLANSELFGHEKGSFTGAHQQHIGFFEQANGGTIFLDEIGELPLSLQANLLLTLQNKKIRRLGGQTLIPLDIRIIAATNRNPQKMVEMGQFRKDLLYRLNAYTIRIPKLQDRPEDIPHLASILLNNLSNELGVSCNPQLLLTEKRILQWMHYHWPGNIRELANHIERLLILGDENDIDIIQEIEEQDASPPSLAQYSRDYIQKIIHQTQGRIAGINGAADLLQLHPNTLRSRLKQLGIAYGKGYQPPQAPPHS